MKRVQKLCTGGFAKSFAKWVVAGMDLDITKNEKVVVDGDMDPKKVCLWQWPVLDEPKADPLAD